MIKPHKYLDINNSLLSVGAEVLKIIMNQRIIRISDLELELKKVKGEQSLEFLMPSLCLLYTVNKIEYHQKIDSIEYLQ